MIFRLIRDLFLPNRCIECGAIIAQQNCLCMDCRLDLPILLDLFSKENSSYTKLRELCEVDKAYALLSFHKKGISQNLLHQMKYKNRPEIGEFLARILWLHIGSELDKEEFDFVLPVPIHRKRLLQRGYNQSVVPAMFLAQKLGVPVRMNKLIRTVNSSSQIHKNRKERIARMRNSFNLCDAKCLEHKKILLVDDVLTTGATLSACIDLLQNKCHAKVSAVTLARV